MIKKFISSALSLVLVVCIGLSGTALSNTKLSGHWAENLVKQDFMEKYFAKYAKDDFKNFMPDYNITYQDFKQSLSSILEEYGYEIEANIEENFMVTRKEAAIIIADELLRHGIIGQNKVSKNPFKDLEGLEKKQIDKIVLLHNLGILKGVSETAFLPEGKTTQIQAVIMFQRIMDFIKNNDKNNIPFKVIDEKTSYSSIEPGITVEDRDDKVFVSIVEQFPHPGYSVKVDGIKKQKDVYNIFLNVQEPDPTKMYTQVITYHNIVLEISKENLGNPPYSFKKTIKLIAEDGNNKTLGDEFKIDVEKVKTIGLYSIDGEKIKQFNADEVKYIIKSFNESKIDDSAYILMLAGNIMIIETEDYKIRITSYGSPTHIVASKETDGKHFSTKHLICPKIAKLLLNKIFL